MSRKSIHKVRCDGCGQGFDFPMGRGKPCIMVCLQRCRQQGWSFGKKDYCDACNAARRHNPKPLKWQA
jgi:hypothetical protein